jgi:hypothetical protein
MSARQVRRRMSQVAAVFPAELTVPLYATEEDTATDVELRLSQPGCYYLVATPEVIFLLLFLSFFFFFFFLSSLFHERSV